MKTILNISVLTFLLLAASSQSFALQENDKVARFSSYVENQRFDFDVYEDDLFRTPSWRTTDEFPPLSPRRAEAIARIQLEELVKESGKKEGSVLHFRHRLLKVRNRRHLLVTFVP